MKIVNSPFSHQETCRCGAVLKYKDSDVFSEVVENENSTIIEMSNSNEYSKLLQYIYKHEATKQVTKYIDTTPVITLRIKFKSLKHSIKCPVCSNEVNICALKNKKSKKETIFQRTIFIDKIIDNITIVEISSFNPVISRDICPLYCLFKMRLYSLVEREIISEETYDNLI